MNMQEIKDIAKDHGIKISRATKLSLIHEIQRTEGNFDCFGTPLTGECDQMGCIWREDCLTLSKKKADA